MIPKVLTSIEKARIMRVVSEAKSIQNAAYQMYADTALWPGSNWGDDPQDPLAGASAGEGFVYPGDDPDMPSSWNGPYLEKWIKNPWGGWYWWDYNHESQNGDAIGQEHVLWIDNGYGNAGHRIPLASRIRIDEVLDDGDLDTGRLQVWQGNHTSGNLGLILIQGE